MKGKGGRKRERESEREKLLHTGFSGSPRADRGNESKCHQLVTFFLPGEPKTFFFLSVIKKQTLFE
jgi:hypothetical protein